MRKKPWATPKPRHITAEGKKPKNVTSTTAAESPTKTNEDKENFGPNWSLAQTWTPHWLVSELWKGLKEAGWNEGDDCVVYDLAAGKGRLVEQIASQCDLVLNDVDPKLCKALKDKFPQAIILNYDIVELLDYPGTLNYTTCIVGSPPWMVHEQTGAYLPQVYAELGCRTLVDKGLMGLVVPFNFDPHLNCKKVYEFIPDQDRLKQEDYFYSIKPAVRIYEKNVVTKFDSII